VIPNLVSCRADCVEVPVDGQGIISSALRDMLENWPENKKMPKYLYTVPYGCNPTGNANAIAAGDIEGIVMYDFRRHRINGTATRSARARAKI
jgi:hypothetical protein